MISSIEQLRREDAGWDSPVRQVPIGFQTHGNPMYNESTPGSPPSPLTYEDAPSPATTRVEPRRGTRQRKAPDLFGDFATNEEIARATDLRRRENRLPPTKQEIEQVITTLEQARSAQGEELDRMIKQVREQLIEYYGRADIAIQLPPENNVDSLMRVADNLYQLAT